MMSESQTDDRDWNFLSGLSFRFIFSYFTLHSIASVLCYIPFIDQIGSAITSVQHSLVPLAGKYIFHLSEPLSYKFHGSGDTLYLWILSFCNLILALVFTVIWSVLDRKRRNYSYPYSAFTGLAEMVGGTAP
jgi:hypothetical protein